ncbi:hypothetical protein K493DRAFT_303527 [Basidiobolus meristosporus CBS 931.73]|uniref:Chromo domain-containing protein n=1 Tax=Basidiobolus meristosporus CBS 931.73 TaxID=1314790 RepID=A0A1Y1Y2F7_9FUNG|nr:hypothetical protein K493DRAFT_303527 [Basidiobolus meristosporus CBS 931.73]|eukprot:ORX92183.1 hypothetical protein K493DRAFT_303527 [Basidiobolus meristosporus CBS 931.73]
MPPSRRNPLGPLSVALRGRLRRFLLANWRLTNNLDAPLDGTQFPQLTTIHQRLLSIYLQPDPPFPTSIPLSLRNQRPSPAQGASSPPRDASRVDFFVGPFHQPISTLTTPHPSLLQPVLPVPQPSIGLVPNPSQVKSSYAPTRSLISVEIPHISLPPPAKSPGKTSLEAVVITKSITCPLRRSITPSRQVRRFLGVHIPGSHVGPHPIRPTQLKWIVRILERSQSMSGKVMYHVCWNDNTTSWESLLEMDTVMHLLEEYEHHQFRYADPGRVVTRPRSNYGQLRFNPGISLKDPMVMGFLTKGSMQ